MESLNRAERTYHAELSKYSERKNAAIERLHSLDPALRDREHRFCVHIWSTVVGERENRRRLEQISQTSEHLKTALELSYQHVHFSGQGQMQYYNGFVVKLWKQIHIRLSGSTLRLGLDNNGVSAAGRCNTSESQQQKSSRLRKNKSSTLADECCLEESLHSGKSRTVMIDNIDRVAVSLKLPLFPRVQRALGNKQLRDNGSTTSTSSGGTSTQEKVEGKAYFTFHFKSSSTSDTNYSASSVYLKQQRERSQAPPKHPIVLCLPAASSQEGGDMSAGARSEGAVSFLNALRAAMPEVEINGSSCLLTAEVMKEYIDNPERERESSFGNLSFSNYSENNREAPLHRGGGSECLLHHSPTHMEWGHLGSGRTSVESLLTADSHRTRSSQGSGNGRNTLSSLDESGGSSSEQDSHCHLPRPLGSVLEERESRNPSAESHSSHSQSRTNSNSLLGGDSKRLPFSNDVLVEHNRFLMQESLQAGTTSPVKQLVERNGIQCCENSSNVDEEEWTNRDFTCKKISDEEEVSSHRKTCDDFSDTIGGACGHRSRSRTYSLEVQAVLNNVSAGISQHASGSDLEESGEAVWEEAGVDVPSTPPTITRPSLLALSLQTFPSSQEQSAGLTCALESKLSGLSGAQEPHISLSVPNEVTTNRATSLPYSTGILRSNPISIGHPRSYARKDANAVKSQSLETSPHTPYPPCLSSSCSDQPFLLTGRDSECSSNSALDLHSLLSDRLSLGPPTTPLPMPASRSVSDSIDTHYSPGEARPSLPSFHSHAHSRKPWPLLKHTRSMGQMTHDPGHRHSISTPRSGQHQHQHSPSHAQQNRSHALTSLPRALSGPAKAASRLLRALSKVRKKRDTIQSRLVKCITEREAHLEVLHYLQSLRTLVKTPPTTALLYEPYTPGSVLTSIKRINRKAFALLTLMRDADSSHPSTATALFPTGSYCEGGSNEKAKAIAARERGLSSLSNMDEECFYNQEQCAASPSVLVDLNLPSSDDEDPEDEDGGPCLSPSCNGEISDSLRCRDESSLMMKDSYEAETFINRMLDSSSPFIANTQEANMMGNSYQSSGSGKFISFDCDGQGTRGYISSPSIADGDKCSVPMAGSTMSDDITRFLVGSSDVDEKDRDRDRGRDSAISVAGNSGCTGSSITSLAQLGAPPGEVMDIHAM